MKKKLLLLFLVVFSIPSLYSQAVQYRDLVFNDMLFRHNTDGSLFENISTGGTGMNIPANAPTTSLYAANLWFGAVLPSGDTATLVGTYNFQGLEYIPGPISTTYDSEYFQRYYTTYLITIDQVKYHREHYLDFGYIPVPEIANWPANGRPGLDTGPLAPFIDVDLNGSYDPGNGDYPAIPGDMNLFYMRNSCSTQSANTTGGKKLKLQVNGFLYAFYAQVEPFNTTLFHKILVVNGGSEPLNNLYCGLWMDIDLGDHLDDYSGTMPDFNAVYAYNSDNNDAGLENAYGSNPPAQGFMWLNASLSSSAIYSSPNDPEKAYAPFYNLISGKNMDGSEKSTPYDFPGDPVNLDPLSEAGLNTTPGDRRQVATTNLGLLLPGGVACAEGAYIWSRSGDSNLDNVTSFRNAAGLVRDFYETTLNGDCYKYAAGINKSTKSLELTVFPNPSSQWISIQGELPAGSYQISIIDCIGKEVLRLPYAETISIHSLSVGLYQIAVLNQSGNRLFSTKLVRN